MQPSELKAIREALGWRQPAMAEALSLSPEFISMMENGKKPIDPRTALAAEQLLEREPPIRVSVGTFGKKFVVIEARRIDGHPGRAHHVLNPSYAALADADAAARRLAEHYGCPHLPFLGADDDRG